MITLNFLERIAEYIIVGYDSKKLSEIALNGLEEGYETNTIITIAGFDDKTNPFIVDEYFNKMIEELQIDLLNENQAALYLIKSIVNKILCHNLDTYEGLNFIFDYILTFTNYRKLDKKFVYDSINLEEVYTLYTKIEEIIQEPTISWDNLKSNEVLINEIKDDIKKRFVKWQKNFNLHNINANC